MALREEDGKIGERLARIKNRLLVFSGKKRCLVEGEGPGPQGALLPEGEAVQSAELRKNASSH